MTVETLLVSSEDSYVIPLSVDYSNEAEKARKKLLLKNYYMQKTYADVCAEYNRFIQNSSAYSAEAAESLRALDTDNFNFLAEEISHFSFLKQPRNFANELENNDFPANIENKQDTIHFDYRLSDAQIPLWVKNLGFKIKPKDNVYDVSYNSTSGTYEAQGFDYTRANVMTSARTISMVRNHFTFPPREYSELKTMLKDFAEAQRLNPQIKLADFAATVQNPRKQSLLQFYINEHNSNKTGALLFLHEVKHIKNDMLEAGLSLKENSKRLSVENYYRLQVEDERSAYLSQVINAVNEYQKKGDFSDFSMFDGESFGLVEKLKQLPEQRRSEFLTDMDKVIKYAFKTFGSEHELNYKNQFKTNLEKKIEGVPLSVPEDTDQSEFKKIRDLYYHYEVYNPQTKRMEYKNLSSYISADREITIDNDVMRNVIEPQKRKLRNRVTDYNRKVAAGEIDPNLVVAAKALKRDNLAEARFVGNVDGLSVANLENTPRPADADTHLQPPPVWSKDLQSYWQRFDGYREIVNSGNEYAFKLKNDTISYKAKDKVNVSAHAEFDTFKKLVNEPSNKNKRVRFEETLSKEQALKLYVACVNSGRKMSGNIPTDFSQLASMRDIPPEEINKFNHIMSQMGAPGTRHAESSQRTVPNNNLQRILEKRQRVR